MSRKENREDKAISYAEFFGLIKLKNEVWSCRKHDTKIGKDHKIGMAIHATSTKRTPPLQK